MKPCQLPAIFLMLVYGQLCLIRAETDREVAEGGNITVACQFNVGLGQKYIFCKNDCEETLVATSGKKVCEGRYCIEYMDNTFPISNIIYVTITKANESDSGQYQCVVDRLHMRNSKEKFYIKVTKDAALNASYILKPEDSPNANPNSGTDLTAQTSDTAIIITVNATQQSLTIGPASFHKSTTFEHQLHSDSASGPTALYVGLSLAVLAALLAAALLVFYCKKRQLKPKVEHAESAEYEQILDPSRIYEEIPDTSPGSGLVEISTVYASASFSNLNEDQTSSDVYSLATAPTAQLQVEDSSNKTVEVDDLKSNDLAVNSAHHSQTEAALSSAVPDQTEDAYYSTLSLPEQ